MSAVGPGEPTLTVFLLAWSGRAEVILVLAALAAIYVIGWSRLRRRRPGAASPWALAAYLGGLAAIALALLSPIDTFGGWLFTLHMLQHQLLAMVGAPLLLLGNPVPVALWALSRRSRRALGAPLARGGPLGRLVRGLTWMPLAWATYMVVLVGWHLPPAVRGRAGGPSRPRRPAPVVLPGGPALLVARRQPGPARPRPRRVRAPHRVRPRRPARPHGPRDEHGPRRSAPLSPLRERPAAVGPDRRSRTSRPGGSRWR